MAAAVHSARFCRERITGRRCCVGAKHSRFLLLNKYEQSRRMAYLGAVCEVIKTLWSWLSALLNSYKLFVAAIG